MSLKRHRMKAKHLHKRYKLKRQDRHIPAMYDPDLTRFLTQMLAPTLRKLSRT